MARRSAGSPAARARALRMTRATDATCIAESSRLCAMKMSKWMSATSTITWMTRPATSGAARL
eukprot:518464-Pyramimonas_sp.AAC.1